MRVRQRRRGGDWRVERAIRELNGQRVLGWLVVKRGLAWWEARRHVDGFLSQPVIGYCANSNWRAIRDGIGFAPVDYGPHVSITPVHGISSDLAWELAMVTCGELQQPPPRKARGGATVVTTDCFDADPDFWARHISGRKR